MVTQNVLIAQMESELLVVRALEAKPPRVMIPDGDTADRAGSVAIEAAAKRLGVAILVKGGKRHDGKLVKPTKKEQDNG